MSLDSGIANLATEVATEFKKIRAAEGSLLDLQTATKSTIIAAINEVNGKAVAAQNGVPADATTTTKGIVRLAGDLAGTATAPTVPALALKADLVAGKVPNTQLPDSAIERVWPTVADQAAMLALSTATIGDTAVRQDAGGGTWRLTSMPPSALASWTQMADQVTSVAGRKGAVVLTKTDVGLANVDNTTDLLKPVSTATQAALNLKANAASPAFTGTPTGITKAHVGLPNADNTADSAKPVSTAQAAAIAAIINDAAPAATATTLSANKIASNISAAVASLVDTAPAALDTLKELATALGGDANFATTTATALGLRLRIDATQTLTSAQKAFGIGNLGAVSAADVGPTDTDYVAIFRAALV